MFIVVSVFGITLPFDCITMLDLQSESGENLRETKHGYILGFRAKLAVFVAMRSLPHIIVHAL